MLSNPRPSSIRKLIHSISASTVEAHLNIQAKVEHSHSIHERDEWCHVRWQSNSAARQEARKRPEADHGALLRQSGLERGRVHRASSLSVRSARHCASVQACRVSLRCASQPQIVRLSRQEGQVIACTCTVQIRVQ